MRRIGFNLPSGFPIPLHKSKHILGKLLCSNLDLNIGIFHHKPFYFMKLDRPIRQHHFEVRLIIGFISQLKIMPFETVAMDFTSKLECA